MTTADLGGRLLASVSRSFYLSIRLLPGGLREPIGLAYLLARASDTIADSAEAPASIRLHHLQCFERMIESPTREGLAELQQNIHPPDLSERELIAHLGSALEWLHAMEPRVLHEIQSVLAKVIRGQMLDVQRFPAAGSATAEIVALQNAAELEEYTYLVAGCVGEFWTRVCYLRVENYSSLPVETLSELGAQFGQGLQLVNVLRDLPRDLANGRCYLPEDELLAAGIAPSDLLSEPQRGRPIVAHWQARASKFLDGGRAYLCRIKPFRVRAACYLPWSLGVETLRLLKQSPALESPQRVKVPRSVVYHALVRAMAAGMSNRALPEADA